MPARDPRYISGSTQFQPFLDQAISGQGANPYYEQLAGVVSRQADEAYEPRRAELARQSMGVGRMGSTFHRGNERRAEEDYQQSLADSLSQLGFQTHEAERGRQMQAAGIQTQRDTAVWQTEAQREIAASQAAASRASAAASAGATRHAAELNAQAQEARTRADFLMSMAGLEEQSRQFDMNQPLQYGGLANSLLSTLGGQDLQQQQLTGNLALGQQQNQLGAAQAGIQGGAQQGALGLDFLGQQLGAMSQIPGLANQDLAALGLGTDFASSLFGTEAGLASSRMAANASRYGTNMSDQLARDQLQYGSVMDQWSGANPTNAINDFLAGLSGLGGLAGGTTYSEGYSAGTPVNPGPSPGSAGLSAGLGTLLSLLGSTGGSGGGFFGGGG